MFGFGKKEVERKQYIEADWATDIFEEACRQIDKYGVEYEPRSLKVKELRNITLCLNRPCNNIVCSRERNISLTYLLAEWLWYISGDCSVDFIGKYAPFWKKIVNADGNTVNSNYGYYMFKQTYNDCVESQFDYVVKTLRVDRDSRQAVVNINNVSHKVEGIKDFPCTVFMQYFIRNNALELTVCMRSTDLVLGYCNDVFQFTMFQVLVYNELKKYEEFADLELGKFVLFTSSLHIYEKHYKMMNEIVNGRRWKRHGLEKNLGNLFNVSKLTYQYFIDRVAKDGCGKIINDILGYQYTIN